MKVYLDNAATTPLDQHVIEAMSSFMGKSYGNPSSIHSFGREARSAIEKARKQVAELLNTSPAEIFFTSGGTEADNMALVGTMLQHQIRHVISTRIEHHAVLHCLQNLEKQGHIQIHFLDLDEKGCISLDQLEHLLSSLDHVMVSLMHANNEIGNLNPIQEIAELCREKNVPFHSDTVQTVGHLPIDLQKTPVDMIVGSAHKFHGPKGAGFLYLHHAHKLPPFIQGGAQERNMRGGTENIYGIVGLAKALELACKDMHSHHQHILSLKKRFIHQLKDCQGVSFNGNCSDLENSLYTVLNVNIPPSDGHEMLLFTLDIEGIAASGGSACSSGSSVGSHVLAELPLQQGSGSVRFSFSRMNTVEEVDYAAKILRKQVEESLLEK